MLFKRDILEGIASGTVTMAFRRWRRPTVSVGGTLRTAVGVLRFTDIATISADAISDGEAARAGFASARAVRAALAPDDGTPIYRITFHRDGADPREALRRDDQLDAAALAELVARLDRAGRAPWTERSLRLIAENPGVRAADLAARDGRERAAEPDSSGRGSGALTLELPRWPLASLASAAHAAEPDSSGRGSGALTLELPRWPLASLARAAHAAEPDSSGRGSGALTLELPRRPLASLARGARAAFKRDIRKLKELGLTESLEVGYRISPRGRALLRHLSNPPAARR